MASQTLHRRSGGAVISHPRDLLSAFGGGTFRREAWDACRDLDLCRLSATADVGRGHLDYLAFNDEFVTIFPRLDIDADLPVQFADSGWVRMHFRLGGRNTTFFDRERRDMRGAFCNILRLPEGMVSTEVHSDRQVGWVTVFCRADFLRREFRLDRVPLSSRAEAALGERAPELVLENFPLPAPAWRLLREIDPVPAGGALSVVRCEAMVTELICLLFDRLAGSGEPARGVSAAEAEKLHQARRIICDSLAEPPTIAALARAVGTNRTTLSRGFRALFGKSVFETIQEERMTRARQLLLDRSLSIGTVAQRLGYGSTASFSFAFSRYWGMAPRDGRNS